MNKKSDEWIDGFQECKKEVIKILHQHLLYEGIVNDDGDEIQYEYIDKDVIEKIKHLNP